MDSIYEIIDENKKNHSRVVTKIEKSNSKYLVKEVIYEKEKESTTFHFWYDQNGRMTSISTRKSSIPFVHRTDFFDSYDGNIYYAIIEKDLRESELSFLYCNLMKRNGTPIYEYEKYEWQEIHHLHPIPEHLIHTETYHKMKEHWKKKRFVLKQRNHESVFSSETFFASFDEFLEMKVIEYAKKMNAKEKLITDSMTLVKKLDKNIQIAYDN